MGCLLCQRVCPANPPLPVEDTGLGFSAGETKALIETPDRLSAHVANGLRKKFAWLGLSYPEDVLGRNLAALTGDRSNEPENCN